MPRVRSPALIRPMLATLGQLPTGPGWGYEFKWDGVRAIVYLNGGAVRVVSRNDRDVVDSYPELVHLSEVVDGRSVVLDGEIVALGVRGAPSFSLLQQRMHVRTPTAALLERIPVKFYAFDLLRQGARPTLKLPYARRRGMLEELRLDDVVVNTPPWWAEDAGQDVMRAAQGLGLEGVVAKQLDSPYLPGMRSRYWIKTPLNTTIEVIIGGWKPGTGRRHGHIGSLLLGMYDDAGRLVYVGHVGTGFTQRMLSDLYEHLAPLRRDSSPFGVPVPRGHARDAQWTEPRLVGEVAYRTVTPGGHLRHPSWRGLRPDREPAVVCVDALR